MQPTLMGFEFYIPDYVYTRGPGVGVRPLSFLPTIASQSVWKANVDAMQVLDAS